jgi:deoxyribonuclease V
MIDLYRACSKITNQIPEGMVSTYGAIANALGDNRAKRAVGVMMNTYTQEYLMPCHRVVYSDGGLGGFAYGLEAKKKRLKPEGVLVREGRIVDFETRLFKDFKSDHPLKKLRKEQQTLAEKVNTADVGTVPDHVVGLDVANKGMMSYAAGVVFDKKNKQIDVIEASKKIPFPYVPTYLAYRELPLLTDIIRKLDDPAVLMVDGNGILHPFGLGIASHLGVLNEIPTIGVAKNLLCGTVKKRPSAAGDHSPILYNEKRIGYALKSTDRAKEIYVSPGHLIDGKTALDLVRSFSEYKLPEPIRKAHQYARTLKLREGVQ